MYIQKVYLDTNCFLHGQMFVFQFIVILVPALIITIFCPVLSVINAFAAILAISDRLLPVHCYENCLFSVPDMLHILFG